MARWNSSFGLAELLLKAPDQLVFVAFAVGKIVVDKLAVGLLEFSLDDVPVTFDLRFDSYPSFAKRPPRRMRSASKLLDRLSEGKLGEKMKVNLTR